MDPIVIASSLAESILFSRIVVMERAHGYCAWSFRNQPVPGPIAPNGELAKHALVWWCIKVRHGWSRTEHSHEAMALMSSDPNSGNCCIKDR